MDDSCDTTLTLALGSYADVAEACLRRNSVRERREAADPNVLFPSGSGGEDDGRGGSHIGQVGEDLMNCRLSLISDDGGDGETRRKLRFSGEQQAWLERSFRQNSMLTATQKTELAAKLNLSPRQIEVWFQNKRARSKLKQNELEFQFLKQCCEGLSDENRRLKEELLWIKQTSPLCPFCQSVAAAPSREYPSTSRPPTGG